MTDKEMRRMEDLCQQLGELQELAKALWPPKPDRVEKLPDRIKTYHDTTWQYHLQQLAIAKDRIEYLRENIS